MTSFAIVIGTAIPGFLFAVFLMVLFAGGSGVRGAEHWSGFTGRAGSLGRMRCDACGGRCDGNTCASGAGKSAMACAAGGEEGVGVDERISAACIYGLRVCSRLLRAVPPPPLRLQRPPHDPDNASVEGADGAPDVGVHGDSDLGVQTQAFLPARGALGAMADKE